jgi:hypothetical protein
MIVRWLSVFLLLASALGHASPGRAETRVDLELILAVDISLSMDLDELRLQRSGYTAALRDPIVQRAMLDGPHGRIAVTYFEWAGAGVQYVIAPWSLLDSPAAINALADTVEAAPTSRERRTSISGALDYAWGLFEKSPFRADRRVIDVSGDGPNNHGRTVTASRDALVERGVIINGLPIVLKRGSTLFDLERLDEYYEDCVIGGPGAFVIAVRERDEFAPAIRRKLLLEVAGVAPPPLRAPRIVPVSAPAPRVSCTFGENQWRRYFEGP